MSDRLFWVLFSLGAVGLIVLGGVAHTVIEAAMRRHFHASERMPVPPQTSHVRTVPNPRQEINQ